MKSTTLLASLAVLASVISTPVLAGDRESDQPCDQQRVTDSPTSKGFDHGMQAVPHSALPDTPGYGWRYFADPVARRAVVVSPQGDYYYSHGKGLRWIAAEQR